jgi:hypothetical protein
MTVSEMISVLVAFKGGKPIQTRVIGTESWWTVEEPIFNFEKQEYRLRVNLPSYRIGVCRLLDGKYEVFVVTTEEQERIEESNSSFLHWETEWRTIHE